MDEDDHVIPKEVTEEDRTYIDELIFENKNINALIKGVEEDLELLKKEDEEVGGKSGDIVRFTIELNILHDKKRRNVESINSLIQKNKQHENA